MSPKYGSDIKDGSYEISVKSSSEMFNIESCTLNVKDSKMSADMVMGGKGYLYVFMGTPEEAVKAEEKDYIKFTEKGGKHVFTVPVEALDKETDCAAFSKKKEKWYDRVLVFDAASLPLSAFKEGVINTAEGRRIQGKCYFGRRLGKGFRGKSRKACSKERKGCCNNNLEQSEL